MRSTLLSALLFLSFSLAWSQVKIGENPQNIDPSSLLELESSSRALVITRVTDSQMQALSPLQGALVYNTDQGCVYYFNGGTWENLCTDENTTNINLELQDSQLILTDSDGNTVSVELGSAIDQTFTTDPIVGFRETIIITQNDENYNFEVGEITGENIVDSSINGIDLQDNSITDNKLAPNSVGQEELQDNAVSDLEIDFSQVTLLDFNNDAGFIALSPEAGNAIINNNGAFYDDTLLQDGITANAQDLADHITADEDLDNQNELILGGSVAGNTLTLDQTGGNPSVDIDISALNNSGTDEQVVDLFDIDSDQLRISLQNDGQAPQTVDLSPYLDNQNATEVSVNATVIPNLDGTNVQDALSELQSDINGLEAAGGADGVVTNVELVAGNLLRFQGTAPGFIGDVNLNGLANTDNQNLENVLNQGSSAGGERMQTFDN